MDTKYNILIIDTDKRVREEYKRILGEEGYNLIFINNQDEFTGEEVLRFGVDRQSKTISANEVIAVAIIAQRLEDFQDFDNVPDWAGSPGLTLIQEIKSMCDFTQVIMITSCRYTEGWDQAWQAGRQWADGYYSKNEVLNDSLKGRIRLESQKFEDSLRTYNEKVLEEEAKR